MSKTRLALSVLLVALSLAGASVAEARVGGGRSSGFRGSRGFTTSQQSRGFGGFGSQQQRAQPQQQQPFSMQQQGSAFGGGSFLRSMAGGLAGGFLGAMLFKSFGNAAGAFGGNGGIGMLEILLICAMAYFGWRMFSRRRQEQAAFSGTNSYAAAPSAPAMPEDEETLAESLRRTNAMFSLDRFKDERMDDFLRIQSAWNERDLSRVRSMIAPEILAEFESSIDDLKRAGRMNRLENIAVRGTKLVEAWQEPGKEFATLRFRANLNDYTVDERTQAVVEGDKSEPVKFEEEWTFVRDASSGVIGQPWRLTAIGQV
jgi:predicted lipid-binding transport protein (Tim44 family)